MDTWGGHTGAIHHRCSLTDFSKSGGIFVRTRVGGTRRRCPTEASLPHFVRFQVIKLAPRTMNVGNKAVLQLRARPGASWAKSVVGVTGFEPATPTSRTSNSE